MATFKEIDGARRLLGLGATATLAEIRSAFLEKVKRHHPDRCPDRKKALCETKTREINAAYELITAYCAGYRFSFREEDFKRAAPDFDVMEHYLHDWMWGDGLEKKT